MEEIHPDLFATVSKARFRAVVDDLAARANGLSENELLVGLMRLAALPGNRNGHGGIFPGDPQHRRTMHLYPIRLYDFDDGTFVVDDDAGGTLIGTRPVAINGRPYGEVAALVRPLVPHDNASNLRGLLPHFLLSAEVLDGLGVADGVGPLAFTFARADGSQFDVTLTPVVAARYVTLFPNPHYGHYPSLLPHASAPMYIAHDRELLWMRTLAGGRAVFVGYNAVTVPTEGPAKRLLALAKKPKVDRVIVDLRLNGGGDNQTFGPLVAALRSPRINRSGHLFVLIGRATFSAGPETSRRSSTARRRRSLHLRAHRRRREKEVPQRPSRGRAAEQRLLGACPGALLGLRGTEQQRPARTCSRSCQSKCASPTSSEAALQCRVFAAQHCPAGRESPRK